MILIGRNDNIICNSKKQTQKNKIQDIKPANLLINENGILKLADFGLARLLKPEDVGRRPFSPQVASRWYRAPEILYGCQTYGTAIDMWATGCVFAEMLRGIPLFAVSTKGFYL